MSETEITTDGLGRLSVKTVNDGIPHRTVISPGSYVEGAWVATDVSGEIEEVQAAAAEAWNSERVTAYRQAFPWVEPPAPEPAAPTLEERIATLEAALAELAA